MDPMRDFRSYHPERRMPSCRVYNDANINIPNNTYTDLTFNSERWDNWEMHSTAANTERITIPITGLYVFGGSVDWALGAADTKRALFVRLNGGAIELAYTSTYSFAGGNSTIQQSVSSIYRFDQGDYITLRVIQNTGGGLNVNSDSNYSPEFWCAMLHHGW
jgi:hypothetical protein